MENRVANFVHMLSSASETQAADILSILDRGMALWHQRQEASAVTPSKPAKAKKEKAPAAPKKASKTPVELPEADGAGPDASDYRIAASAIDESVCIGRNLKGGEDKRWKPIIFRESQCGGKLVEGSDLCSKCCKRQEKYAADPKPGDWTGRVTEDPLDWVHMLGTEWADEKKPKFLGTPTSNSSSSASDAGSVASADSEENASVEEMPVSSSASAVAKVSKAAEKEAAAATKKAEREAEKAKKAAEKEAAAAAKKAEKEAAAAAKAAEKEAAAAAKKAAKKPAAAAKKAAAPAEAKVTAAAEPVEVEGELKLIDGTLYMLKKGNVYEYDELAEKVGDFVGRITAEETIDTEAEEQGAAESDSE